MTLKLWPRRYGDSDGYGGYFRQSPLWGWIPARPCMLCPDGRLSTPAAWRFTSTLFEAPEPTRRKHRKHRKGHRL